MPREYNGRDLYRFDCEKCQGFFWLFTTDPEWPADPNCFTCAACQLPHADCVVKKRPWREFWSRIKYRMGWF